MIARLLPLFITLFCSFLVAGCASTKIDETWTLPGYQPPANKKVLVIVLSSRETVRELVELEFVKHMKAEGIEAIASIDHLAETKVVNRQAVKPVVEKLGITLVMVSSLRDIEKNKVYQPDDNIGLEDSLYRNIDTYYTYSSSGQHESGHYVETLEYIVETNLFDVASEKLSWSVNTRTLEPASIEKGAESIVSTVLKQAYQDGIL